MSGRYIELTKDNISPDFLYLFEDDDAMEEWIEKHSGKIFDRLQIIGEQLLDDRICMLAAYTGITSEFAR